MATITYRIRSKKEIVPIYIILSNGVNNFFEVKTGLSIKSNDWSISKKMPKQNIDNNKRIANELEKLKLHVYSSLTLAQSNQSVLDKLWFKNVIDSYFGKSRNVEVDSNIVINHIEHMINNASMRKIGGRNEIGLSHNSIKAYKTFRNLMFRYENEVLKKTIKFMDINKIFIENFNRWLTNEMKYSVNYIGKTNQFLKTVCNDAKKSEIKVNPYCEHIERFSEKNENRNIVTLSFKELNIIYNHNFHQDYLDNARKWILIGCEIGQRGEDLLSITFKNIRYSEGEMLIDVYQTKTKKYVVCSVPNPNIREILTKQFPHKISIQKLNLYIKEVCKIVGINQVIKGKITSSSNINKSSRRLVGMYPKYELITSHCFRRSFSTNYYKKIPTPIIMGITGHSKESQFLQYINRNVDKDENALLFKKHYDSIENTLVG